MSRPMEGATKRRRALAGVWEHRSSAHAALALAGLAAVAVAVAAWPVQSIQPGVAGDWSWIAALSQVAHNGWRYGEQIVWSYGPLGLLATPFGPVLYYGEVFAASWLFAALVQLLLAGTLLVALRRSFPLPVAVLLAAVVLVLVPDRALALGFAWCALALTHPDQRTRADGRARLSAAALALAIGAMTGVLLLGKLNQGVQMLAFAAVVLAARPSRRDVAAFAGGLLTVAAAGWLGTGQRLADVWPYLRNGVETIAGYADAMGTTDPAHGWAFAVSLALGAFALALVWDATRAAEPRRRWGLRVLCALYLAANFKEGFVREEVGHVELFLGDLLVLFALLPVRRWRRALVLAGIVAGVVAFAALMPGAIFTRMVNPVENARAAADQAAALTSAARRTAVIAGLRQQIAATYNFSPELAIVLEGRTVMFWPHLFADVAYGNDLDLRPAPTLEPYAAYTPALDRLTAGMLASARAPERIVRSTDAFAPAVDGRHPTFEAPLATLAILCRYRAITAEGPWQVLARAPDRCGTPRMAGTLTARWGARVDVPRPARPDALVLARVEGAEPRGLERLQALLLRPRRRWIELDGQRYRLVAATAADGLLLRAPPRADFRAPFALAPNPSRIAVGRDGGQPGGRLRYTFVEVPIRR